MRGSVTEPSNHNNLLCTKPKGGNQATELDGWLQYSSWLMNVLLCFSGNCKIIVSNIPAHSRLDELEQLATQYGSVQSFDKIGSRDGTQTVSVVYEGQDQAQQ